MDCTSSSNQHMAESDSDSDSDEWVSEEENENEHECVADENDIDSDDSSDERLIHNNNNNINDSPAKGSVLYPNKAKVSIQISLHVTNENDIEHSNSSSIVDESTMELFHKNKRRRKDGSMVGGNETSKYDSERKKIVIVQLRKLFTMFKVRSVLVSVTFMNTYFVLNVGFGLGV